MSSEKNLIAKILYTRDLSDVIDAGITPNFFLTPEHRQAYESIVRHQTKHGVVPTIETFQLDFPEASYRLPPAEDAITFYLDEVVADYRHDILESGIVEVMDHFDAADDVEASNAMARTQTVLNQEISSTRVTDLTETTTRRMERYIAYTKGDGGIKGISSGFAAIDKATNGYQPKQLVTYVGPPKAGKSTIMLLCEIAAHKQFYRPLFCGFEMSNEEQEERHDSIWAGVDHKKLREGTLSREELNKIQRMHRRLESMPQAIFSEDANSSSTLSGVFAQVDRYKPDILFVDGVYMMDDENGEKKGSPQALTNLTRGFKVGAKNFGIPVVISTQVLEWKMDRKKGVTSGSIGYSSSFIQDSDVVIAVEKTDESDVNKVKILMGRNTPGMEVYVKWDWATGEFEELEDDYEPGQSIDNETVVQF